MHEWLSISLLLCTFGFLKEIRPSEPFVYEYLTGGRWNVTADQVTQLVFPIGTYSCFVQLVVVFLITDLCRYKSLIVVIALSGIIVWSMLIWGSTLLHLQILEVFYGTFVATETAYYTYIYAKVAKEFYTKVTSHTRAAILAGRFASGVSAQVLYQFKLMDYRQLNYITLSAMILATIWSLFLPPATKTIYFHQTSVTPVKSSKYRNAFALMSTHFVSSFSNMYVVKWSLWWILATAGFIQVQTYMQPLWSEIYHEDTNQTLNNGTVEALLTLIGFVGALAVGFIKIDWRFKGDLVLSVCCIFQGALLLISSQTDNIVTCYACYVLFGGSYHFAITLASSEIAKNIEEDSYGLVFGFNMWVALLLQSILTMVFVSGTLGWTLMPRNQYLIYGNYHIVIAALFVMIGIVTWLRSQNDINKMY